MMITKYEICANLAYEKFYIPFFADHEAKLVLYDLHESKTNETDVYFDYRDYIKY